MDKREAGKRAEEFAVEYLIKQGYKIIARNYRSNSGEIDIIAEDSDCLVFVEVRSRQGERFGLPCETVDWVKQQKVRKQAGIYLRVHNAWKRNCRFDVVGVLINADGTCKSIELVKDAF